MSPNQAKLFPIVISIVAIIAIGLQVPAITEQRNLAEDQQKSEDISSLSNNVQTYSSSRSSLPSSLSQLTIEDKGLKSRLGNYEYKTESSGEGSFEICATFKTKSKGNGYSAYPAYGVAEDTKLQSPLISPEKTGDPYEHDKGRECFTFQSYYAYKYSDPYAGKGFDDGSSSSATPPSATTKPL